MISALLVGAVVILAAKKYNLDALKLVCSGGNAFPQTSSYMILAVFTVAMITPAYLYRSVFEKSGTHLLTLLSSSLTYKQCKRMRKRFLDVRVSQTLRMRIALRRTLQTTQACINITILQVVFSSLPNKTPK